MKSNQHALSRATEARIDRILAGGPKDNVARAGVLVSRFFEQFASKISEAEKQDFFHPANRANWQGEFGRWLEERKGSTD